MNPGRHRTKNPRHAANGAKPAHGPPHPDERLASSPHSAYQVPTYEPGPDDTPRGRHAALHTSGNGRSGQGALLVGGAADGTVADGANGNGHNGNGHSGAAALILDVEADGADDNGHSGEGIDTVTDNGNGHQPLDASVQITEVEPVALPESPAADPTEAEPNVSPLHGTTRIRYGARQIGTGSTDLARDTLDSLRRHLPRRLRTISRGALVLALVLVLAGILVAAGVATRAVVTRLKGPANVAVATAGPAVIQNTPGGVGTIQAAPQNVATVSLDVQGVTAPIEVTAVDVIANQQVAAGAPLLQLDPVPFEQDLQQVQLALQQSRQTLASAEAALANQQTAGSGGAYLSVQVPTLQGQVALNEQLLQIAEGNATAITAPIAGYVSQVHVATGQVVRSGQNLMQVVDPSQVLVDAGMQLSDLQAISPGDTATITPSQLPGVHLQGTVVAVSAAASGDGLEGTVVVTAPNVPTHPVPIGTQSIVNVSAPTTAAVSVPSLAVLNVDLAPVVGVVSHDRIHFQPVQIGASDGSRTQILSGLAVGQVVAVSNMQELSDGDKVRPSVGGL
jgi:RND family efflux transporter MFP subunit